MVWDKVYFSSTRIKAVNGRTTLIAVPDQPHTFIEYPSNLLKKTRLKAVNEMIYGHDFNNFKVVFDDSAEVYFITKDEFESCFSKEHSKMHDKLFARYRK